MSLPVFRAFLWECPNLGAEIDFLPPHFCDFGAPLAGQDEQPDQWPEWPAYGDRGAPDSLKLFVSQYAVPTFLGRWSSNSSAWRGINQAALARPAAHATQGRERPVSLDGCTVCDLIEQDMNVRFLDFR
jgi:hypothetical protein